MPMPGLTFAKTQIARLTEGAETVARRTSNRIQANMTWGAVPLVRVGLKHDQFLAANGFVKDNSFLDLHNKLGHLTIDTLKATGGGEYKANIAQSALQHVMNGNTAFPKKLSQLLNLTGVNLTYLKDAIIASSGGTLEGKLPLLSAAAFKEYYPQVRQRALEVARQLPPNLDRSEFTSGGQLAKALDLTNRRLDDVYVPKSWSG